MLNRLKVFLGEPNLIHKNTPNQFVGDCLCLNFVTQIETL
jgi:hypothetical protein